MMQDDQSPDSEPAQQVNEEAALGGKLAETIQANSALRERLAELDIRTNIEKAELKREIETLISEKEDLLRENESLLHDLSSQEEKVRELSRSLKIKELFFEEAGEYFNSAKEQVKGWEMKCRELESLVAGMKEEMTVLREREEEGEILSLREKSYALEAALDERTKENLSLRERISDCESEMNAVQDEMEVRLSSETGKLRAAAQEERERHQADVAALRDECGASLVQKDGEIGALAEAVERLKEEQEEASRGREQAERDAAELRERSQALEYSLSVKEEVLREMEGRLSGITEHGHREKEELYQKLEESRREILSLTEARESLAEALRERDEENDLLKGEIENALAEKNDEFRALMKDYEEKARRLSDEKVSLETRLRQTEETLSASLGAAAEREGSLRTSEARISLLEGLLAERDRSLPALEEELRDARERASSLGQALQEKENSLAAVKKAHEEASDRMISVAETLTRTETTVSELRQEIVSLSMDRDALKGERDALSAQLLEGESLNASLSEKVAAAERAFEEEVARRAESEDAVALGEAALREAMASHKAETERMGSEMQRLVDDAARERTGRQRVEDEIARSRLRTAELEGIISEHVERIEHQRTEIERFRGETSRLEHDLASLAESASREKESIEEALDLRGREVEKYAEKAKNLEAVISGASQRTAFLENLVAEREAAVEKANTMLKGLEGLAAEREGLAGKLTEALEEAEALRDVRTFLSGEIGRLKEELKGLRDESETHHLTLRNDLEKTFSKISESAGRLEHAVSEGMSLVKRQGEGPLGENLPATLRQATPGEPRDRGRPATRTVVAVLLTVLVLAVALAIFLGEGIHTSLKPGKPDTTVSSPPPPLPWAEGVKETRSGGYSVTLIFLNKEAVSALGLSRKITDAGMAENRYALLEIRAEGGCISDDFLSAYDKEITFFDKKGTTIPLTIPDDLVTERRVVYKANMCNKRTAAVSVSGVISVPRSLGVDGLKILGLDREGPVFLR